MHKGKTVDEAIGWLVENNSRGEVNILLSELETARQLEAKGTISVREVTSDNAGTIAVFIKLTPQAIQRLQRP